MILRVCGSLPAHAGSRVFVVLVENGVLKSLLCMAFARPEYHAWLSNVFCLVSTGCPLHLDAVIISQ